MKDHFIRLGLITPEIRVADVRHNYGQLDSLLAEAERRGVEVCVTPELCLTGYTVQDLLGQDLLLEAAEKALLDLARSSVYSDMVFFVGTPFRYGHKLYNAAVCIRKGKILAVIPKTYLQDDGGTFESRYFSKGPEKPLLIEEGPFEGAYLGSRILFQAMDSPKTCLAVEIGTDLLVPYSPSISHALAGANVILNLSASRAGVGMAAYRRDLVRIQSSKLICAYAYTSAGEGESSQDAVYSGHQLIFEEGTLLAEASQPGLLTADVDLGRLEADRRRMTAYPKEDAEGYQKIFIKSPLREDALERKVSPYPFIPQDPQACKDSCREILDIQARGLAKRLDHTGISRVVLGLSGGLDSTLALLVCLEAYKRLGLAPKGILAVTMPGFGTTDRTYQNALLLADRAGVELREISIAKSVTQHYEDIGLGLDDRGPAYENGQARERTQILMDLANMENGLVIGTGDLSELALGWCTYGGDQISMYGVNASIPKTLVRALVDYVAGETEDEKLSQTLRDILDTPVSPELLPTEEGRMVQKTEDVIGPYILHDFTLYYLLRYGYRPRKILKLARLAFEGLYRPETILKWMKVFYRRFFSQRFKSSMMADGVAVGSLSLSPRGDWRMPSDAVSALWIQEIEQLEKDERNANGR